MSFIVEQKVRNIVYLYESESYRDEMGRPRSKRKIIGKIDKNGNKVYKEEYMKRMADEGKPVPMPAAFSTEQIQNSSIKEIGAFHFFKKIGERIGLIQILDKTFPFLWKEIFDMACFLLATGDPLMYCGDWLTKTEGFPADLSSPRISELLPEIDFYKQEMFYEEWSAYRREREYLALDITSVSSYSKLIKDVERGYNRDGEKLPQINLCMLLGETSRLPVFEKIYSGSLKDVSTLRTSLKTLYAIGKQKLNLVMDKGFYSAKNLKMLLEGPEKENFIIAVPFTTDLAKSAVEKERSSIGAFEYAIPWGRQSIQGICRETEWENSKIYIHVFFNMVKEADSRSEVYGYAASLAEMARSDPENKELKEDFAHYLKISKNEKTGKLKVTAREDVIEKEYIHDGWMVLISNYCNSPKEALGIYRTKDVIEKGFYRMKHDLDFRRLRIHSDPSMEGKSFLVFIALILLSYIHTTMIEKGMYKYLSLKELIRHLEKLKVQIISGCRIMHPLTKMQKLIYENFSMDYPA